MSMKYMGSKARFVKEILPIILKDRKENQWFVDLFCGGCSIAQEVDGKVIGNFNYDPIKVCSTPSVLTVK